MREIVQFYRVWQRGAQKKALRQGWFSAGSARLGGGAAAAIRAELSKAQEATVNAEKFMSIVRKHTSFEELTPTLLREFVEKIVIHEAEPLDGKRHGKLRRQNIDIYYSFVGKVDLPE